MEERVMDDEEARGIKLVHTPEGDDVVDALAETDGEEYDEDLVGLTPSQLEEVLAKRKRAEERAEEEYAKLLAEGDGAYNSGDFTGAAAFYRQAAVYKDEARTKLFAALTEGYKNSNCFYEEGGLEEFLLCPPELRGEVVEAMRPVLEKEKGEYEEEAEPLRAKVEEGMNTRREAFAAHKKYYFVRFLAVFAVFFVLAVGTAVAGSFILRTADAVPLIATVVLGAVTLAVLAVLIVYARKLYAASRLCSDNEKLSSTEDGARLEALDARLEVLGFLLGSEE